MIEQIAKSLSEILTAILNLGSKIDELNSKFANANMNPPGSTTRGGKKGENKETPAPPTPAPGAGTPPAEAQVDYEALRSEISAGLTGYCTRKKSPDEGVKLLQKYGAGGLKEIDPKHYPALVLDVRALLASEKSESVGAFA